MIKFSTLNKTTKWWNYKTRSWLSSKNSCVFETVFVCAHTARYLSSGGCMIVRWTYMLEIVFVSFKKRGRMKAMIFFFFKRSIISSLAIVDCTRNRKMKNKRSIFIGLCVWLGEAKKKKILSLVRHKFWFFKTCNYTFVIIEPHEVKRFKRM